MKELILSIRYILPAVVVFFTAYYFLREFARREEKSRQLKYMEERQKLSMPVRLQAYERIVLFLERITPGNLVMRVHKSQQNVKQFQQLLIKTIRDEYDHNLSQQLYVSQEGWEKVKNAKEEIIHQINVSAGTLEESATSTDLSKKLLEMSVSKLATKKALDYIKAEARKIL